MSAKVTVRTEHGALPAGDFADLLCRGVRDDTYLEAAHAAAETRLGSISAHPPGGGCG